jgi:hypothetical protein
MNADRGQRWPEMRDVGVDADRGRGVRQMRDRREMLNKNDTKDREVEQIKNREQS